MADAHIPDKPALEGLEAKWDAAWEREGTYRFDRLRAAEVGRAGIFSRRHSPADRVAAACTSATCSATPTRTSWRATSACAARPSSTRWAGTTTACPPSAACRTTTACAATRRCPTTRTSCRRYEGGDNKSSTRPPTRCRSAAATSSSCARRSPSRTRSSSRTLWRQLGLSVDWTQTYRTIGRRGASAAPARVPAQPRARRGLPGDGARRCGTSTFRTAVAQAELEDQRAAGRLPPRRLPQARRRRRRHRDDPPRAARRLRRPRRASRRRALPAALRHDRDAPRCSASRCRCSRTTSPSRTRARASP